MNSHKLVIIDSLSAPISILFALILRAKNIALRFVVPTLFKSNSVLVLKLVGAGNFIPLAHHCNSSNFVFLTLRSNVSTIRFFIPNARIIVLDDRSLPRLALSIFCFVFSNLFRTFDHVINMEIESKFAKFLSNVGIANKNSTISNRHKSFSDVLLFDDVTVFNGVISRSQMFRAILDKEQFYTAASFDLSGQRFVDEFDTVILAPTCSETDKNRRVSHEIWMITIERLAARFSNIIVVFSNFDDRQYNSFLQMSNCYSNVEVVKTDYQTFCELIANSSATVCVDSQALHVSQYYNVPTLCFYGPTSPTGIDLGSKTLVVSRSLKCSPCTHLYFKSPCGDRAYCMNFSAFQIHRALDEFLSRSGDC